MMSQLLFRRLFPPSRSVGSFLNETAKLFHGETLFGNLRHLGKRFCFLDQKDMSDSIPRSVFWAFNGFKERRFGDWGVSAEASVKHNWILILRYFGGEKNRLESIAHCGRTFSLQVFFHLWGLQYVKIKHGGWGMEGLSAPGLKEHQEDKEKSAFLSQSAVLCSHHLNWCPRSLGNIWKCCI